MMKLTISLLMCITLSFIMMMVCSLISKNSIMDRNKMSPFECGFNPLSNSRTPFSIQFFLMAVLFLIFDVEIAIIIPIIITMKSSINSSWILTIMIFLIILMIGLYHEWNNGVLEWAH